jgi:hypothetical protein
MTVHIYMNLSYVVGLFVRVTRRNPNYPRRGAALPRISRMAVGKRMRRRGVCVCVCMERERGGEGSLRHCNGRVRLFVANRISRRMCVSIGALSKQCSHSILDIAMMVRTEAQVPRSRAAHTVTIDGISPLGPGP